MPLPNFNQLVKKLKIKFNNKRLLTNVFTHSSSVKDTETSKRKSNEVLEFLGDAVLELVVREYLIKKYPTYDEGELNRLKKIYTNEQTLYQIGYELELGNYLILDRGEELTGGRTRPSNIANCLEALIGALYLDQGLNAAKLFIQKTILKRKIKEAEDYKSILNEWIMQKGYKIDYQVVDEIGPPHQKVFYVDLYINNKKSARGKGKTKKEAEQEAARTFIKKHGLKLI